MKFLSTLRFIFATSILILTYAPSSAQISYKDIVGKWSFESAKIEGTPRAEFDYTLEYKNRKLRLEIQQDGTIVETFMDKNNMTGEYLGEKNVFLKLESTMAGDLLSNPSLIFPNTAGWELIDGKLIIHCTWRGDHPIDLIFKKQ